MAVLVTGGGGFLGRYIVEHLRARGKQVRSLARGQYPELAALGVECIQGSVADEATVNRACAGIDTVYHVAAIPGVWGPWKRYHDVNTLGTKHIIAACRQHGVKQLIYTSSPSVVYDGQSHDQADETLPYPDHYLCHYPHSKALGERAVLAANGPQLATVALRPHLIWGPRDNHLLPRLIQRAMSGRLRRVGDGTNRISMAYVENVAAAHLQAAAALHPGSSVAGQAYFINEPEPVNLWNWIDELLGIAGLPPVKKRISARMAWTAGAILEGIYGTLRWESEPMMTRFVASQLSQSHCYSVEKAHRDFGYAPQVSVSEGMQRIEPELKALVASLRG